VQTVRQSGLSRYAIELEVFVKVLPRVVDVDLSTRGLDKIVQRLKCRRGDAQVTPYASGNSEICDLTAFFRGRHAMAVGRARRVGKGYQRELAYQERRSAS